MAYPWLSGKVSISFYLHDHLCDFSTVIGTPKTNEKQKEDNSLGVSSRRLINLFTYYVTQETKRT